MFSSNSKKLTDSEIIISSKTELQNLQLELDKGFLELSLKPEQLQEEIDKKKQLIQSLVSEENKSTELKRENFILQKLNRLQQNQQYVKELKEYISNENIEHDELLNSETKDQNFTHSMMENQKETKLLIQLSESEILESSELIKELSKSNDLKDNSNKSNNSENQQKIIVSEQQSMEDQKENIKSDYLVEILSNKFNLQSDFEQLPNCTEKCLLNIIVVILTIIENRGVSSNMEMITSIYKELKDRLSIENKNQFEYHQHLKQLKNCINNQLWDKAISESEQILKIVRPFNTQELFRLIKKSESYAPQLKDQDIILLLGCTGAGKSTLVHYLSGQKMIDITVQIGNDTKTYIGPDPNSMMKKDLQEVKIGFTNNSETKYIKPVRVNYLDRRENSQSVIIVDTPGQNDTQGAEYDIANGLGIIQGIKSCKSVKPVIVLRYRNLGNRCEGIKQLVNFLTSFLHNLNDTASCFYYVFMEYPKDFAFKAEFNNIATIFEKEGFSQNDPQIILIEELIQQTKKNPFLIDLKDDKSNEIVNTISTGVKAISNPEQVFKKCIKPDSISALEMQVKLDLQSLNSGLKRKEFELVFYKLKQIRELKDILEYPFLKTDYEESVQIVSEELNKYQYETINIINNKMDNRNQLLDEDINNYKSCYQQFQTIEQNIIEHFKDQVKGASIFIDNLIEQINSMKFDFTDMISLSQNLSYLKLLSQHFKEAEEIYKTKCQIFLQHIQDHSISIKKQITSNEFKTFAFGLTQCQNQIQILTLHVDNNQQDLGRFYLNLKESFLKYLTDKAKHVEEILNNVIFISDSDVQKIEEILGQIYQAQFTIELVQHFELDGIIKIYSFVIDTIINYFNEIIQKINSYFQNEFDNSIIDIAEQFKNLDKLRKIEIIESKTSKQYYQIITNINSFIENQKSEVEKLSQQIVNNQGFNSYDNLTMKIVELQDIKFVDKRIQSTLQKAIQRYNKTLMQHLLQLQSKIQDIDLSIYKPGNLIQIKELLEQVEKMHPVHLIFKDIQQVSERIQQKIQFEVFRILCQIHLKYGQSRESIQFKAMEQQILLQYKNECYSHAWDYLKLQGFESNEQYNIEINILNEFNKMNTEKEQLNSMINDLEKGKNSEQSKEEQGLKDESLKIEDLQQKILINKEKMKKLQEQCSKQFTDLQQIQKIYSEKQNFNEQQIFLQLDIYEDEKLNKNTQFFNVDCDHIEQSISFLELCSEIKQYREKAQNEQKEIKLFLEQQQKIVKNENKQLFEKIKQQQIQVPEKDIEQVQNNFQKINQLKEYPKTFKLISGKDILEEGKVFLRNQYHLLNKESKSNMSIVQILSQFDFIAENSQFSDLYEKIEKRISDNSQEVNGLIQNQITNNDFSNILMTLQEMNDINLQNSLPKITIKIQNHIKQLILKINRNLLVDDMDITINEKQITDVIQTLDCINQGQNVFKNDYQKLNIVDKSLIESTKQHLHDIEGQIKDIINQLTTLFIKRVGQTLDSIKQHSYSQAETNKYNMKRIYIQLKQNKYINQEVENSNTELDNLVKKCEDQLVEFSLDIYKFSLNQPKFILENLLKVKNNNSEPYKKMYQMFQQRIKDKYKEEYEQQYLQKLDDDYSDKLQEINKSLVFLDEQTKKCIKDDFKVLKKEVEKQQKLLSEEYNSCTQSNINIQKIKVLLLKCLEKKYTNTKNKLLREISESIKKIHITINQKLKQEGQLEEALSNLNVLYEYYDCFSKIFKDEGLQIPKSDIKDYFDSMVSIILKLGTDFDANQIKIQFKIFTQFYYFHQTSNLDQELGNKYFEEKQIEIFNRLSEYFLTNQEQFTKSLKDFNIIELDKIFKIIQSSDELLLEINQFYSNNETTNLLVQNLSKTFKQCDFSPALSEIIINAFLEVKDEIEKNILSLDEDMKQQNYEAINKNLNLLKNAALLFQTKEVKDSLTKIYNEAQKKLADTIGQLIQDVETILKTNRLLEEKHLQSIRQVMERLQLYKSQIKIDIKQLNNFEELIKQQLMPRINSLCKVYKFSELKEIFNNLIQIKQISLCIYQFKIEINKKIDDYLMQFTLLKKTDIDAFTRLTNLLEAEGNIGIKIIQQHSIFKGYQNAMWNKNIQSKGINDEEFKKRFSGDYLSMENIFKNYQDFDKEYQKLLKSYTCQIDQQEQTIEMIVQQLIKTIKNSVNPIVDEKISWDQKVRNNIPILMAQIFCLWTINNISYFVERKGKSEDFRNQYLMQPFLGQVISIFRLLGLGYNKLPNEKFINQQGLQNNLVQISTGEGKSLTLAVVSSILALHGFEVHCACYSKYLSERDYKQFSQLFKQLEIEQYIKYDTFNEVCESLINSNGVIRQRVINQFKDVKSEVYRKNQNRQSKILLIDEADKFFSAEFYGNQYTPLAKLQDPVIVKLMNYIWKKKPLKSYKCILSSQEYKDCCSKFKGWDTILLKQVYNIFVDLQTFQQDHSYIVVKDKIGYKDHDTLSFSINYRYKTMFAYFHEYEKGNITLKSLNDNIFIGIYCGSFSYSEITSEYDYIFGVTGTLDSLSEQEKKVIEDYYKIKLKTIIPSVFGDNKCNFSDTHDVYVENKNDYFKVIRTQIDQKLQISVGDQRAVLVFFESEQKLKECYNSIEIQSIKFQIQIIKEQDTLSFNQMEYSVTKATTSGQITFLEKVFGRGTDFKTNDLKVKNNGGIHVIQTFYSESPSEEIQIKGRTAREGNNGSFNMILLDDDLQKFLGSDYKNIIVKLRRNKNIYNGLNDYRKKYQKIVFNQLNQKVQDIKVVHKKSLEFIEILNNFDNERFKNIILYFNESDPNLFKKVSRTICLMDATGSMDKLLLNVKNTIIQMFDRIGDILRDKKINEDSFQMQFAVYRDYDQMQEGILQASQWESNASNLKNFITNVSAVGGDDVEEAIEIGLLHVNSENKLSEVSQVILIGDAPAKTTEQIKKDRIKYGGENYWLNSKFGQITDYQKQIKILQENHIPVHTFYLKQEIQQHFKSIADETGGTSKYLDINSKDSSEILTNIVTEEILKNIGLYYGNSEELVKAYQIKYSYK